MSDAKQEVFAALADPNRRTIIEILIADGAKTATQLADDLPISRQGITKHLNILAAAGLVTVVQRGRDKYYYLTPEPLEETAVWLAAIAARWDKRLHKLHELLEPGQESS
ncbi:MAG: metalloregulator ArsR/SmtB family transcription factor [Candidatus Promineifilaceae bacterium]|nr:metalloregulator ArsR/SmtB family transcription factor [Candidatus Promineifilaceae bacterium]